MVVINVVVARRRMAVTFDKFQGHPDSPNKTSAASATASSNNTTNSAATANNNNNNNNANNHHNNNHNNHHHPHHHHLRSGHIDQHQHNRGSTNLNMSAVSSMQQKMLRWNDAAAATAPGVASSGASAAVGSPGRSSALARRSSNPAPGPASASAAAANATLAVTASLVSSVSSLLLDNMREQAVAAAAAGGAPNGQSAHHRKLDRSQSEPAPSTAAAVAAAQAMKAANINTSRYKTELCRPFEENGACKYGDKCQFAHGAHELRSLVRHPKYKTELCRTFHSIGFCPYGPRCHFIHNADEARNKPKPLELAAVTVGGGGGGGNGHHHHHLGGSTAESPTSSLSQSPTNSVGSFFTDGGDVFGSLSPPPQTPHPAFAFGQDFNTLVQLSGKAATAGGSMSPRSSPTGSVGSISPRGSPPPPAQHQLQQQAVIGGATGGGSCSAAGGGGGGENSPRLPVFNRLSSAVQMGLGGLEELLA